MSLTAQSLECTICQELYDEPKQLSCTHTFCLKCLADLLEFNTKEQHLTCPVCRKETHMDNRDVSTLQTNYPIKSLVEEVKATEKVCTARDHEKRALSIAYCQTCGVYMCAGCLDIHGQWKSNGNHGVIKSEDIKSGKVKVKQVCDKHPHETLEWACSTCKVSICFRCRMLYHNGPEHEVEEVAAFQRELHEEAEALQKEAEEKVDLIKAHTERVFEGKDKTKSLLNERVADVIRAYNEYVEKLTEDKNELVTHLLQCKEGLSTSLDNLQETDSVLLNGIVSTAELVCKGAEGFLEGESLVVHQRLRDELKELMAKAVRDGTELADITTRAEGIRFIRHCNKSELQLGKIDESHSPSPSDQSDTPPSEVTVNLQKMSSFPISGAGLSDMAATPDGKMAVSYTRGGMDLFTIDGLQDTVLRNTSILSVGVLSDGRYAVLEPKFFSIYSPRFERVINSKFSVHKRNCLCIGSTDQIIVCHGNSYDNKLSQFRPESGKFLKYYEKDIPTPDRALYMACSSSLIMCYDTSIQVLNDEYKTVFAVDVDGSKPCPVVLDDGSIMIGWVKDGCATVELYTQDLRFIKTVLEGFKVRGDDFIMRQFSTGEIAICDSRYIHIFQSS